MPDPVKTPPRRGVISRLWRDFAGPYKGHLVALAPILALVAGAGTAYGFLMKAVTDALNEGQMSVLTWAPIALIGATTIRALAIWGQAILTQLFGFKIVRDLQNALFAKYIRADFETLQTEPTAAQVSRFTNDMTVIGESLVRSAQALVRDLLTILGALAAMLSFDMVLSLVVITAFAATAWPLAAIAKMARRRTDATQRQLGALTATLQESLANPRIVKTFGLEDRESARAAAAFEARRKLGMKQTYNRARVDPMMEIIGGVALAGVLWLSASRILGQHMTIGDLLGMITMIGVASPAARSLGSFNTLINEGRAALTRVFAVIDAPDHIRDPAQPVPLGRAQGHITFEGVCFDYQTSGKRERVLDGVSFEVRPGETLALVGPSGSGKSTILNLIPRLFDPNGGRILLDGTDIRDHTLADLRAQIALVAQDPGVIDDTLATNIALGVAGLPGAATPSREALLAAAHAAALDPTLARLPEGLEALAGENGGNLSGGERQRLAIARAFLRDAPILLLDEATSALDSESEAHIQATLEKLRANRTCVIVAHRLATIVSADRILVLDAGRIVESGTHETLVAAGGLYAQLAERQFLART